MSSYKFVTREDFNAAKDLAGCEGYTEKLDNCFERLIAERDAYRKVALLLYIGQRQLTIKKEGGTIETDYIDAEAMRLMEKK